MRDRSAPVHHVHMDETASDGSEATREGLAWFGVEPGPDDWVNATWIGRNGSAELRIVDLMTGPGRHTLLVQMDPDDEPAMRWDDLDYENLQSVLDEVKALAAKHQFFLWDFAGPAVAVPALEDDAQPG